MNEKDFIIGDEIDMLTKEKLIMPVLASPSANAGIATSQQQFTGFYLAARAKFCLGLTAWSTDMTTHVLDHMFGDANTRKVFVPPYWKLSVHPSMSRNVVWERNEDHLPSVKYNSDRELFSQVATQVEKKHAKMPIMVFTDLPESEVARYAAFRSHLIGLANEYDLAFMDR